MVSDTNVNYNSKYDAATVKYNNAASIFSIDVADRPFCLLRHAQQPSTNCASFVLHTDTALDQYLNLHCKKIFQQVLPISA